MEYLILVFLFPNEYQELFFAGVDEGLTMEQSFKSTLSMMMIFNPDDYDRWIEDIKEIESIYSNAKESE